MLTSRKTLAGTHHPSRFAPRGTLGGSTQTGFTLVEIVIAMVILVVVLGFAAKLFSIVTSPTAPPNPVPVTIANIVTSAATATTGTTVTGVFVGGPWPGSGTGTLGTSARVVTFRLTDANGNGVSATVTYTLPCSETNFNLPSGSSSPVNVTTGIARTSIKAVQNQTAGGCIIKASVTLPNASGTTSTGTADSPPFEVDGTSSNP